MPETRTPTLPSDIAMRPASNQDRDRVIAHIDAVYREYGDRVCLENADSDLLDLEANYPPARAEFMLFERDGDLLGTLAVVLLEPGKATFRRLYLREDQRGSGIGEAMFNWGIDTARRMGAREISYWSDTRFTRAHAFFARHGFAKGPTREMDDGHEPYSEFYFSRRVDPV